MTQHSIWQPMTDSEARVVAFAFRRRLPVPFAGSSTQRFVAEGSITRELQGEIDFLLLDPEMTSTDMDDLQSLVSYLTSRSSTWSRVRYQLRALTF